MSVIQTKVKNKKLIQKRREQIVLAAIKLFAQQGFHKTTLKELANEAGISQANIYEYVTNKEDIFFLIHEFIDGLAENDLDKSIKGIKDPIEKLRRMIRSEFNIMHQWADAILIIYRETHVLDKPFLYKLLEKERQHVSKYESVLKECIKKGLIRNINVRAAANLIKTMMETWVVKRWDLREYINRLDMEKCIFELTFSGLDKKSITALSKNHLTETLQGLTALVVNGGTQLGKAVTYFLISKGVKVVVYKKDVMGSHDFPDNELKGQKNLTLYSSKDFGEMTINLFKKIVDEAGPIDIIVHELGMNYTEPADLKKENRTIMELEANLKCAKDLAIAIESGIPKNNLRGIIHLAPWGWDSYADPFRYETVKEGAVALTKIMAKRLASRKIRINCIIPGFISGIKPSKLEKEKISALLHIIPMGNLGEISDVLDALYFLVSDNSKYMTGNVFNISGGLDYSWLEKIEDE